MKGFTLIEILIYITALAFLVIGGVNTFLTTYKALAEIRTVRTINSVGASSIERITRTIRDAASVDVVGSVLNTYPGKLALIGSEQPSGLTHVFSLNNFVLQVQDGASPLLSLTPPGALVTNLVFRLITASTTSQASKVELTIAASSGKATTTENFYSTVVLRGSYAE